MIINWYKYIREMLPPRLRLTRLVELLRVLVFQIPKIGSDFDLSLAQLKYKVNVNASVIALEKLIETELDALADIEELDGKPFDFLVNVHSPVDEILLKALVSQYKIAGKSFSFKLGAVDYTSEFINHECEDIIELYTVEFTDHICEEDGTNEITLFLGFTGGGSMRITANAQRPVKSNISIAGSIVGYNNDQHALDGGSFNITINTGFDNGADDIELNPEAELYNFNVNTLGVTPSSDEYYNYVIESRL